MLPKFEYISYTLHFVKYLTDSSLCNAQKKIIDLSDLLELLNVVTES